MNIEQQIMAGWLNRPLAMLPEFARAPYVNTKPTNAGIVKSNGRNIAVIQISGALTSDQSDARYGIQSYADIRRNFFEAVQSPEASAIALLIDSPGGHASGCFDLADAIYQARGTKPIHAILNEHAYSAAYAIASAADRITVPRTGGAGSVGVIRMHTDISGLLDKNGIKVTPLTYGAFKADGHPTQPLTDESKARAMERLTEIGDLFVGTIARNRGMKTETVKATEAATFMGGKAVEIGFVDDVAAPDVAFRRLRLSI